MVEVVWAVEKYDGCQPAILSRNRGAISNDGAAKSRGSKNMAESLSGMTNSLQQTLAKFHF